MSNCLDLRCPKCGDDREIDIKVALWVRVMDNGTNPDAASRGCDYFTPGSQAVCGACGHWAVVMDFTPVASRSHLEH